MGISLSQYRQAIGLFNNVKFMKCQCNIKCIFLPLVLLLMICILLIRAGIEQNPGPVVPKIKHLKICHVNIRGLNSSKLRAIHTALCNVYDVITLSETFLTNSISSTELSLPGFNEILRRDRPTFGGGVAVYVKQALSFKRLLDLEDPNLEQIWLQLNTTEGKIFTCVTYRPPQLIDFWQHLENNFEHVKSLNPTVKYYMLLGDLNADFATINGRHLQEFCASQNMVHHINEPTRITQTSQTCLDQIITNMPNFIRSVSVLPPVSTNDHCTVDAELNFKLPVDKAYTRLTWQYKDADYV